MKNMSEKNIPTIVQLSSLESVGVGSSILELKIE